MLPIKKLFDHCQCTHNQRGFCRKDYFNQQMLWQSSQNYFFLNVIRQDKKKLHMTEITMQLNLNMLQNKPLIMRKCRVVLSCVVWISTLTCPWVVVQLNPRFWASKLQSSARRWRIKAVYGEGDRGSCCSYANTRKTNQSMKCLK